MHLVLHGGGSNGHESVTLGLAYREGTAYDLYPDAVINGSVLRSTNPTTLVFPYCLATGQSALNTLNSQIACLVEHNQILDRQSIS